MRVDVRAWKPIFESDVNLVKQDPEIQKATGKTDPVDVMAKLREMKNSFKWVSSKVLWIQSTDAKPPPRLPPDAKIWEMTS